MFPSRKLITIQIQGRASWIVAQHLQDGHWFGVCPALNLNAAGDNWTEFWECVTEAHTLLFDTLFKGGELEAFLREQGWKTDTPLPPPGTRTRFEIPFGIEHRDRVEEVAGAIA